MDENQYRVVWIGPTPWSHWDLAWQSKRLCAVRIPDVGHYIREAQDRDVAVLLEAWRASWPDEGQQLVAALWRLRLPPAPIFVLTEPTTIELQQAWRLGAADVLCAPWECDQLVLRVWQTARKWWPLGRALASTRPWVHREASLSLREWQLCHLLAQGKNLKWIAARWKLSPHTVRNHRRKLLEKLHIESDTQLAHSWTSLRWLERLSALWNNASYPGNGRLFVPPHWTTNDESDEEEWPFDGT